MSLNVQEFKYFNKSISMKNSILNLGKALNKAEQKTVNGGAAPVCTGNEIACFCPELGWFCSYNGYCD